MAKTDKEKIKDLKEKLKAEKAENKFLIAAFKRVEQEKYYYKQRSETLRKELIKCNEEKNSGLINSENPGLLF
jgi:predicted nuclease with TOPRIM domain